MEKKVHFYVSWKSPLTWLMALCMVCSAVARILFVDLKGADAWSQIVLPIAATILYVLICLLTGKERFYKTAIPIWMLCVYYAFTFFAYDFESFDILIGSLFSIAMLFVGVLYTQITCGKIKVTLLILLLAAFPVISRLYLERDVFSYDAAAWLHLLPDALFALGLCIVIFAIRVHPADEYHPTWGDRTDGRRLRTLDPMSQVSPYIMVTRNTCDNSFAESFEITNLERYIRQKRKAGMTSFGLTHVLLACYCRAMAHYPGLNRFIAGQKVYTHGNDIQFCMTIKKEMTSTSPETLIKVHLSPYDTLTDVYEKTNAEIEKAKNAPLDSDFDNTAQLLTFIPGLLLKFTVWLLKTLDYFGLLPAFLLEVSPFHGSVFFTSMGSLGIPPIYHHLYDFGNLPVFCSFGCKRRALEVQEDGSIIQKKYLDCKFTMDERTVDGFYYAAFFKYFKRLLAHPEILENPPEEVVPDID